MFAKICLSLLLATLASCYPDGHRWHEPEGHRWHHPLSTDRRSPCPGINALANHGYLPRNGLNISLEQFITGVREGYNFGPDVAIFAVQAYQPFTTTGNNNTLNLNDLDHHSIPGEHDGSLSRNDLYFGDAHSFNKTMWDKTAAHFQNKTISVAAAARAIRDRYDVGFATTPKFMPSVISSLGEAGLYLRAMQGHFKETKTQYVQILFREERIPFKEGYKKSNVSITTTDLARIGDEIRPMLGKYKDLEG